MIGLWHGAEWRFMVFGLLQGVALSYEMVTKKIRKRIAGWIPLSITSNAEILFTFGFFSLCCVFIQATDVPHALRFIHDLFFNFSIHQSSFAYFRQILFFTFPILFVQFLQFKKNDLLAVLHLPLWARGIIYFIMYYLVAIYGVEGGKEFIYFQF